MSHSFVLPGELTIFTVTETRGALLVWLSHLDDDAPVVLIADQTLDVDGAGIQLLCATAALLEHQGRSWSIAQPAAPLTQACATLGLADWLRLARTDASRQADVAPLAAEPA
jgi:anti-anti-sigma regulatory factor